MGFGIIYTKNGQRCYTVADDRMVDKIKLRLQERGLEIQETIQFKNDADIRNFLAREMGIIKKFKPADKTTEWTDPAIGTEPII
jgi:DNA-binding transcriptional MerR regulator